MPTSGIVKQNTYRDSVALMVISSRLSELPGVFQASAMMGTPANKEILVATKLLVDMFADTRPNDLCVAVDAADGSALAAALEEAERLLGGGATRGSPRPYVNAERRPRTLESGLRRRPDANLAMISVPGEYAAFEARRALHSGLHVFLFSDNVPLEEEIALKSLADDLGLLVMGPDCGTALIGGAPLGFANTVRRGGIGIVASSGTGLQEVACLIHRFGEGVSHALGTGSRDLRAAVGGRAFLAALGALGSNPLTRVLLLVAKPGAPEVQARIYETLAGLGKPAVVYFLGAAHQLPNEPVVFAQDLEHAARCAVALLRGEHPPLASTATVTAEEIAQRVYVDLAPGQMAVRGLFAGGTLAQEAATAIRQALGVPEDTDHEPEAGELLNLNGHRILDLGDDAYTRGRPHPLIDPRLRSDLLVAQAALGDVALFVIDIILGYGTHADPAGTLLPALERARQAAADAGARLHILASITGTADDPQDYSLQRSALERAGVIVAESSSVAALAAGRLASLAGIV